MAKSDDSFSGLTDIDPTRLRAPEGGSSRVDTLPEEFAKLLSRKTIGTGHVIGNRYKLLERLGGGAMGDVFVAENLSIGTRVAVKLLKPDLLADAQFRQRFQREAQAIANIEHPNVARFYDLVVGDPTFLVMEYVRGQTLSAALRESKRLEVPRAVAIARRLCWALHASHAAGIIHRDLKPSNVILTSDVEHDEVPKLIDFGLAKLAARAEEQSLTRTGQLIGTPQYMSPEQISGKHVDARTDIYALGCLLYEMLTGRAPFVGDDDFQVLYKQVHETPDRLGKHLAGAPAALEGVLACMLAKLPEERYVTMADAAVALKAAVDATGDVERPPAMQQPPVSLASLRGHTHPGARGNPLRTFLIVGTAVIVLGFGGGFAASRLGVGLSRRHAAIFVLSEPAGALVEVDGKSLAQTTPTLVHDVSPGAHTIKIQRVGTAPVTQTINAKAGERSVVQVTLPPSSHRVEVRTVPDGAQVLLDSKLVLGETPTTVDVTDEEFHELRIEKTGFETIVKPLTPDDKQAMLSFTLQPEKAARGTLMVDANTAAELWVDGINTGYTTPTLGIEIPVGQHQVEVRDASGAKGQSTTVTIAQGQTVRLLMGVGK
jgi:tRNA A-37 threonylcarbamoyl transferase component Bud32